MTSALPASLPLMAVTRKPVGTMPFGVSTSLSPEPRWLCVTVRSQLRKLWDGF